MSFVKHFKQAIPPRLEIPDVLFRDTMKEHVILDYKGEKTHMRVEASDDESRHWISCWGDFASRKHISVGTIVCFSIVNDNVFFLESFPPTRGRRRRQGAPEDSARSEAVVENYPNNNNNKNTSKKRSSSPSPDDNSSKDAAKPAAGSYHDCQREYYVPGTESAVRNATSMQKNSLGNKSSIVMVMPSANAITSSGLEFKRVFAEEYCSWNRGGIYVKDIRDKVWDVVWDGSKIGPEFIDFFGAHDLEQGDVCIFVVQMGGFQVHIFKTEVPSGRRRPLATAAAGPAISDQDSMMHHDNNNDNFNNNNNHHHHHQPAPEEYARPGPEEYPRTPNAGPAVGDAVATPNLAPEEEEGLQEIRISFKKDASGKYKRHIIAELALGQNQFNKLSFESPQDLLKSLSRMED